MSNLSANFTYVQNSDHAKNSEDQSFISFFYKKDSTLLENPESDLDSSKLSFKSLSLKLSLSLIKI